MEYLFVLIGLLVGSIISNIIFFIRYRTVGTLRIDHSDPVKDVYRIEIDDLDGLIKKSMSSSKWIIMQTFRRNNISYYGTN